MRDRLVILGVSLLMLISAVGRHIAFEQVERQRYLEQQRVEVSNELGRLRAAIEGQLHESLLLSRSLAAYVSLHPGVTQPEFEDMAKELLSSPAPFRHVALARANVVSHIYPRQGNERAIGLDYLADSAQRGGVLRAMQLRQSVVDGPVDLVQGSRAVISRTPIWLPPDATGNRTYWGVASAVIDLDQLTSLAGLRSVSALNVALRQIRSRQPFFGEAEIFDDDPVVIDLSTPSPGWQLAATPRGGWSSKSPNLPWVRLQAVFMLIIFGLLLLVVVRDQQRIRHMALHDNLTGLPNRLLLNDRIGQSVAKSRRYGQPFAVLQLDLDDFKPINDRFGHRAGDAILAQVATRLQSCMRAVDTVARTGGDEFVVLLPDLRGPADASAVAAKIIEAMNLPFEVHGETCHIGVSIGIALSPDDGVDAETLIRAADQAMYKAKESGKNTASFSRAHAV